MNPKNVGPVEATNDNFHTVCVAFSTIHIAVLLEPDVLALHGHTRSLFSCGILVDVAVTSTIRAFYLYNRLPDPQQSQLTMPSGVAPIWGKSGFITNPDNSILAATVNDAASG